MAYTRRPLSGGAHGVGVKVVAVATPGTTIHTAQASATLVDVITLYAYNSDTQSRQLTLEWGGTTAPDNNMGFTIPTKTTVLIITDLLLRNSLVLKAFADAANVVVLHGFINTEA